MKNKKYKKRYAIPQIDFCSFEEDENISVSSISTKIVEVDTMEINIKKLTEEAILPEYQHTPVEDAGMDLHTIEEGVLEPGQHRLFKTGIAIELPSGFMGRIVPRSGLAYKHGITVLNSDGLIDPAYRGDLGVILINHGDKPYQVMKSDRIAQLVVEKYQAVEWNRVEKLNDTVRSDGGFGHTGRR